ncbi:MAG: tetratricopeptide repeat protein [Bacteroidaceae bacterium]|nr:tetratricopeptide repeat protein [Bacteroidaceae bacterium]
MDLKAFNKLYSEAVEGIAERRVLDTIALIEAINADVTENSKQPPKSNLSEQYHTILQQFTAGRKDAMNDEYLCSLIDTLETARFNWLTSHKPTSYSRIASKLSDYSTAELTDQIQRTTRSYLGLRAYSEALDAAFGIAWCCQITCTDALLESLKAADNFTRRVLVGGLLLGVLDSFSIDKINVLLSMVNMVDETLGRSDIDANEDQMLEDENASNDLLVRVFVALTLIAQRYKHYLPFYHTTYSELYEFFHSEFVLAKAPELLHAFVCQSLTDRVGKRVDDILPIVEEAFKNQQTFLGSNHEENEDEEKKEKEPGFNIQVAKIELKAGKKLFEKMANYAASVDIMRRNDMDVNHSNFIHMKRFEFFDHIAHWFYPFNMNEPIIHIGLHHPDGKLDKMTLNIMNHSRFCDSDRYSYAAMMAYLRREGGHSISDSVRDQIESMKEDDDDALYGLFESEESQLNPFTNFCQTCYRYFHSQQVGQQYDYTFAPTDDIILPTLPIFEDVFMEIGLIQDSVEAYLQMGDNEHAIILLNYMMEHFGTTASALEQKGRALMSLRQWRSAIGCFQQRVLMEEDPFSELCMARCFEALHDWESALPLLITEDERLEGKDASIIEEIARCLIQLNSWEEAVQRFFKLEFMGQNLTVSQRGIGWCSLHQGKYERAEQYYRQLIDKARRKQWEDYINLGHALWLQGRTTEAVEAYRQFVAAFNRTKENQRHHFKHWTEAFHEDATNLLAAHFTKDELALMQDAIVQS